MDEGVWRDEGCMKELSWQETENRMMSDLDLKNMTQQLKTIKRLQGHLTYLCMYLIY